MPSVGLQRFFEVPAGYRIGMRGTLVQSGPAQDSFKSVMPLVVSLMLTLILVGQVNENRRDGDDRHTAVIEVIIRLVRPPGAG